MGLGIIDRPLRMLNDKFGWNVLVIQIWKNLPFQLLIIASVLETIQTDIEDAARNLGANPLPGHPAHPAAAVGARAS